MSASPAATGKAFLGTFVLCLLPELPLAQSMTDLDRLVFEPSLVPENGAADRPVGRTPPATLPLQLPETDTRERPSAMEEYTAIADDEEEYIEAIRETETRDGAYADELLQNLVALGNLYQQEGDYEKAVDTYERAEHVSRINHGLFDETQFPIIEKAIETFMAMGDIGQAMKYQRYLAYLTEKYYGKNDLSTVPALVDLADQNMGVFTRIVGSNEPVVSFNVAVGQGAGSSRSQDPRRQAFGNLLAAQGNYVKAILALIENRAFFRPEILALEYDYLETLFLQANGRAILADPDYYLSERSSAVTGSRLLSRFSRRNSWGYVEGKNTFERILVYLRNNPDAPPEAIAAALMDYGDWHLLFDNNMSAINSYKDAYALLQAEAVAPDVIRKVVSPAIPVQLPLITSKPNSREKFGIPANANLQPDGFIDVAFTINRYGSAKWIKIVGKSAGTTSPVEKRLKRYLRNAPFRPRFIDGEPARSDRVTLRYFYTFLPEDGKDVSSDI